MIVKILKTQVRDNNLNWDPKTFSSKYPTYEEDNLITKLNTIIEWDNVIWPIDAKETGEAKELARSQGKSDEEIDNIIVRDSKYYGDNPELKPGDAFSIGGQGNLQIIRVISDNTIGLEHTETGGLALNRLVTELITPEIEMTFNNNLCSSQVEIESCDNIPEEYSLKRVIPYHLYKIWSERFYPGREGTWDKGNTIKATINSDITLFPIDCYINKSNIYFREIDIFDNDMAYTLVKDIMSWFYNNFPRLEMGSSNSTKSNISFKDLQTSNNYSPQTGLVDLTQDSKD